ncbi:MAG: hypothetical protein KBC35_03445 [Candidatus Pacebacteria bacterium]|nr:hypothetical protein [Candidatus Paceibacterota bacterium]
MNWIRKQLFRRYLKKHFVLDKDSLHGPTHWQKVEQIGLAIARKNGADQAVVSLFAWLHDACRKNEFIDEEHGERAAKLASQLRGPLLSLPNDQFEKLHYAIKFHAHGMVCEDPTVGTCWDADRLDLGRVGTAPQAEYMSTEEGKLLVSRIGK